MLDKIKDHRYFKAATALIVLCVVCLAFYQAWHVVTYGTKTGFCPNPGHWTGIWRSPMPEGYWTEYAAQAAREAERNGCYRQ